MKRVFGKRKTPITAGKLELSSRYQNTSHQGQTSKLDGPHQNTLVNVNTWCWVEIRLCIFIQHEILPNTRQEINQFSDLDFLSCLLYLVS